MERNKLMNLLWSYKFASNKEQSTAEKIEMLRSSKTSLCISYDGLPGGGHSTMADYIARLTDLEAELNHYASDKLIAYNKVTDLISSLRSETDRELMYQRYIMWRSWLEIADDMHYTYAYVRNKHMSIIDKLAKDVT